MKPGLAAYYRRGRVERIAKRIFEAYVRRVSGMPLKPTWEQTSIHVKKEWLMIAEEAIKEIREQEIGRAASIDAR